MTLRHSSRPLPFKATLEVSLRRAEQRAAIAFFSVVGLVIGGAIALGCVIAHVLGLLVDPHHPAPRPPIVEAWAAYAALVIALGAVGVIAAKILGSFR